MTGSMAHMIVTEWHKLSIVAVAKVKLSPSLCDPRYMTRFERFMNAGAWAC